MLAGRLVWLPWALVGLALVIAVASLAIMPILDTDLEQIRTAVLAVLGETMQPERASLLLITRGQPGVE